MLFVTAFDEHDMSKEVLSGYAPVDYALDDADIALGLFDHLVVISDPSPRASGHLRKLCKRFFGDYCYERLGWGGSVRLPDASAHDAKFAPCSE